VAAIRLSHSHEPNVAVIRVSRPVLAWTISHLLTLSCPVLCRYDWMCNRGCVSVCVCVSLRLPLPLPLPLPLRLPLPLPLPLRLRVWVCAGRYAGEAEGELSFEEGDVIEVVSLAAPSHPCLIFLFVMAGCRKNTFLSPGGVWPQLAGALPPVHLDWRACGEPRDLSARSQTVL